MRILLIDDHVPYREELGRLLGERGVDVFATDVGDGREHARLAADLAADLILLDMGGAAANACNVLGAWHELGLPVPIVIITASEDEQDLVVALRAGVQGYLLKDIDAESLLAAVHQVLKGETVIAPQLIGALARIVSVGLQAPPTGLAGLTPREREILQHLATGLSNKAIARALAITDGTVKLHVKSILRKLSVESRVEAAVIAVDQGLAADLLVRAPPTGLAGLTPREREILQHLATGLSNKAIARALAITDGTVKLRVKSILRKLKANSRVEAAVTAVRQGLARTTPPQS